MPREIILSETGTAPNTRITPFRYIDPEEIARITDGIIKNEDGGIPHSIEYPELGVSIIGINNTLRCRADRVAPWFSNGDDGLNVHVNIGPVQIHLYHSVVLTRPEAVTFVLDSASRLRREGIVSYIQLAREGATLSTMSIGRQRLVDPDIARATELAKVWNPILEELVAERQREANKELWAVVNAQMTERQITAV